jgi:hypothetical protein
MGKIVSKAQERLKFTNKRKHGDKKISERPRAGRMATIVETLDRAGLKLLAPPPFQRLRQHVFADRAGRRYLLRSASLFRHRPESAVGRVYDYEVWAVDFLRVKNENIDFVLFGLFEREQLQYVLCVALDDIKVERTTIMRDKISKWLLQKQVLWDCHAPRKLLLDVVKSDAVA